MQKHIKVYHEHYWITPWEIILCEVCSKQIVDIHHIEYRGKFWKNRKHEQDSIGNLIALYRECHEKAHKWIYTKEFLYGNIGWNWITEI
jgi:hypothetical protein